MTDLDRIDGLFVGMLDLEEYEAFTQACKNGLACRDFEGVGGLLGMAKVKIIRKEPVE
jgi:hypothetical protein